MPKEHIANPSDTFEIFMATSGQSSASKPGLSSALGAPVRSHYLTPSEKKSLRLKAKQASAKLAKQAF